MRSLLLIAVRSLLRHRRRSLIAAFAIVLGIAALVSSRGMMRGFDYAAVADIAEARLGALAVHQRDYLASSETAPLTLDLPGDAAFLSRIASTDGVAAATPRLSFVGAVSSGDHTLFAQMLGIDPAREYVALPHARDNIAVGRPIERAGEALLGSELAAALHLQLGDDVIFLANDRDGVLNAAQAKLVGLIAAKTPADKRVAHIALADADALLRMHGRVTEVVVAIKGPADGDGLEPTRAALERTLGPEVRVASWKEMARSLDDMMLFQKLVLSVLGAIVIVVVLAGIANTMLMSVLERVREIGTMMALGVRRRQIRMLFLIESALLGLGGGIVGALAGSAIVWALNRHGIDLPPPGMIGHNIIRPFVTLSYEIFAVAVATLGATASALYPAAKAAKLRPVEALTHV